MARYTELPMKLSDGPRVAIALILTACLSCSSAFGWGREGHAIIAAVAESRLTPQTLKAVRALLGNHSLASIASWADQVRPERDETYNWHFVDIPMSVAGFDDSRDCFLPRDKHAGAATDHQNCVVDRITFFAKVLANGAGEQQQEALKFVVHFVGDIHQPFHAIREARGGNGIHLSFFGTTNCPFQGRSAPCNLHAVWDDGLIQHAARTEGQYVALVRSLIAEQHLDAGDLGKPEGWANESHKLAEEARIDQGGSIDQGYYQKEITVINKQLALAAVRLADLLERSLSGK